MARPPCHHPGCRNPATSRITGANLNTPLDACDRHTDDAQRTAGVPRRTDLIEDDGQEVLFEMPTNNTGGNLR